MSRRANFCIIIYYMLYRIYKGLLFSIGSKIFTFATLQFLSNPVLSAVGERYYKVTAEALRVCGELVRVVRPNIEVSLVCIANLYF